MTHPHGGERLNALEADFVNVHIVHVAEETAFGYLCGFGSRVGLDFIRFYLMVEVLYVDLEQAAGAAGRATGVATDIVAVVD